LWREVGEIAQAKDFADVALDTSCLPDGYVEVEPAAHARLQLAECALFVDDEAEAARWLDELSHTVLDSVAFGWRVDLHRLELQARLEPGRAEELLAMASKYGSLKYRALALARLGRHEEAAKVASATKSDLLLAHVAPEPEATRAAERIAERLRPEDRARFLERGSWVNDSRLR